MQSQAWKGLPFQSELQGGECPSDVLTGPFQLRRVVVFHSLQKEEALQAV